MSKKIFSLIAVALIAMSALVLASCKKKDSSYDSSNFLTQEEASALGTPYRIVKEPITITVFAPHSAGYPEYSELKMFKYLSEVTGINFNWITPDSAAYFSQRAAVWQTGTNMPDLFLFNNSISEQVQYMESGYNAFVPFNDDSYSYSVGGETIKVGNLINNYMPNYKAILDSNFGIDSSKESMVETGTLSDGKMYTAVTASDVARDLTYKMFINQEWIDNINENYGGYNDVLLKNADEITTIEEYLTILRAFKELDANDNGDPNDEIPVTSKSLEYLRNFILQAYGYVTYGMEIEDDYSDYTFVPYTEAYRKYLEFMNTIWKEGLLHDSTFSITTDSQMAQYGTKNRLGSFVSAAAYIITGYEYESNYTTFGPLTSEYYTGTPKQWGFGYFQADGATIPTTTKYVREVARLIDIMYSDLGAQLIAYGVEGEDWTWDNAEKTSWTFNVPSTWTGNQEQYRGTITPNAGSGSSLLWSNDFVGKMNDDIIMRLNEMSEKYLPYLKNPEPSAIKMTSEEYSRITTIKASLDPQLEYLEASYIRGDDNKDPFNDASWQSFLDTLKGFGADELISCYRAALNRYKAK